MPAASTTPVLDQPIRGRGFAATFAAAVAGVLLSTAAATVWRDPFWIFRAAPPWTQDGAGASRLLDTQMRRVKPLQIAGLRPGTLLIGSSVVYRGLDPRDLEPGLPQPAYNAGLSSLMGEELPVLAALARDVGSIRRVVIGLDYFMFTRLVPPPPLRPEIASALGRAEMRLKLMFNSEAPENLLGGGQRRSEPGLWRSDGFKSTPDFDAALTRKVAAAQDIAAMAYEPGRLAALDAALGRLRGLDIALYLSPVSGAQLVLLAQGGRRAEFERWRADAAALARRHGFVLHDLSTGHPFTDFDPEMGSSRFWIDNVHFKPEVGRWVLARLGLASGAVAPAP
ncbi:hypothetical protein [Bosea sp. CS1GBMeth4]|uniref:hypothetical protein n=1 Tax=Bosea sp. CS1GBMeth4 TaxID=1892849 RepID=UPI001648828E|nr:hypothetical protein [Bosea sp. CS1GBMeth4]